MTGLAIYLEGGGDGKESRAKLRRGMGEFLRELRDLSRDKSLRWKIVPCGGRNQAFKGFRNSVRQSGASVSILLVDAEGPVGAGPRQHLVLRDRWDLGFACERELQLMIQSMETWIVADPDALAGYYGRDFAGNAIPGRGADLEALDRGEIMRGLARATRRTAKREYQKIRDGSLLLEKIDPATVQGRCPACSRLFETLKVLIARA